MPLPFYATVSLFLSYFASFVNLEPLYYNHSIFVYRVHSWYGIVIPFTLDLVTNRGFALLTKYGILETGTRHLAIFFYL